jgi:hypothetical protein
VPGRVQRDGVDVGETRVGGSELGPALDHVSAENARAYFRHCGYDRPD